MLEILAFKARSSCWLANLRRIATGESRTSVEALSSPAEIRSAQMSHQEHSHRAAKARLFLVEAHVMVRQGITALINQEADLTVCGAVSATPAALEAIPNLKPDLVLADITLKNVHGLEMIK